MTPPLNQLFALTESLISHTDKELTAAGTAVPTDPCPFCHMSPCRCDTYLVGDRKLAAWEESDGEYMNKYAARRLIATVRSLRARL